MGVHTHTQILGFKHLLYEKLWEIPEKYDNTWIYLYYFYVENLIKRNFNKKDGFILNAW